MIVFLMVLFAAIIGSAGMVGVMWWIHARIRGLEDGSPGDVRRLLAENATLHEQVEAMRSELFALDQRVDFTEKLIGQKPTDRFISPPTTE